MSEEPEIMQEKYRLRGEPGEDTVTLEWTNEHGRKLAKPATPAEAILVRQVGSLLSALRVSMKRNAGYEASLKALTEASAKKGKA